MAEVHTQWRNSPNCGEARLGRVVEIRDSKTHELGTLSLSRNDFAGLRSSLKSRSPEASLTAIGEGRLCIDRANSRQSHREAKVAVSPRVPLATK